MIAGTYVLTDQMRGGFMKLNRSVYAGVDVEVAPKEAFSSQFSAAKPLSEGLIDEVRAVQGHPGGGRPVGIWSACCRRRAERSAAAARSPPHRGTLQARFERRRPHAGTLRARSRCTSDTAEKRDPRAGDSLGIATRDGTVQVTVVVSTTSEARTQAARTWSQPPATSSAGSTGKAVTTINVAGADGLAPEELSSASTGCAAGRPASRAAPAPRQRARARTRSATRSTSS